MGSRELEGSNINEQQKWIANPFIKASHTV
jgi:hypothetical protein